jgi:hypothetical protein
MIMLQPFLERRICRQSCCANIPQRKDGRVWYGIANRDADGNLHGHVIANEAGFDDYTYIFQISKLGGMKFEADEWEALEPV